jgi:alkylhydroperoxidase/carboxymuconolactone decarboxylase family protein YurZ
MMAESPLLDLIAGMTRESMEASTLDPRTMMLVRLAALVAVDGPPLSYEMNVESGADVGIDVDLLRAVLITIAPIVGAPRIVSAAGKIADALGIDIETFAE